MKNATWFNLAALWVSAYPCFQPLIADEGSSRRQAWCIGIDRYAAMPELRNARNDAKLVGNLFAQHSFLSEEVFDAGISDLRGAVRKMLEARSDVSVFFFTGHGVEVEGENYLLPADFPELGSPNLDLMAERSLPLREVFEAVRDLDGIKLIVLDCCRDNPFDGAGGGLAPVKASELPDRTLLIFSGAPGTVVSDGEGTNSPFTEQLCAKATPGLSILDLAAVVQEELKVQRPWVAFNGAASSLKSLMETPLLPGRLVSASEAKGIQTVKFGERATVKGSLSRIKTYDRNGRAVYPFFLTTERKLIVEPTVDFDPGSTGVLLDGLEVKVLGGSDDALEVMNGKMVEINNGLISSGLDLHCHPMGFFVDSIEKIQVLPSDE